MTKDGGTRMTLKVRINADVIVIESLISVFEKS